MTQRTTLIGIAITAVLGIATLIGFTHDGAQATPGGPEVTRTTAEPTTSTTLPAVSSTTAKAVTQKSQTPRDFSRPVAHISETTSSTTTSEVPALLTAEQEASIPDVELDPDANEHMSHNFDLPSEVTNP